MFKTTTINALLALITPSVTGSDPNTMFNTTTINALLALITLLYAPTVWKSLIYNYKLRSIPTVGSSGFWTSYLCALRFFRNAHAMVQRGYDKYRESMFKVPWYSKWMIVVSGPEMINEIRSASEDHLSAREAGRERMQADFCLGHDAVHDQYHVEVIKQPLTRHIEHASADIHDEIVTAFNDHIKCQGNEWTTITAYSTMMDIVYRTHNRMLVGLPLCRNPDYLQINKQFPLNFYKTARILDLFPSFLRPIVAQLLPYIHKDIECEHKYLEPLFNARFEQDARLGKDWPERPVGDLPFPSPYLVDRFTMKNDAISWLIDYSNSKQSNALRTRGMALRMLLINFSANHTTTMGFTHVLFDLASRPEYVQPMRDEVEAMIREEGWSKSAIGKMRKLDSFIKESLRFSNFFLFLIQRKVMKDFTFSTGVTIPAGNTVAASIFTNIDPQYYTGGNTFDGFRFEKMRNGEGMENKHQIASLDLNYIVFGNGRHACPGRFFAAHELKVLLAHVLLNYDVQMANGGGRPVNHIFGLGTLPNPTAQVMFRKRVI